MTEATNETPVSIVGGPLDNTAQTPNVPTAEPVPTQETAPATPATTTQPTPIYVGGKKFATQEEMLAYFSELEAQRSLQQQQIQTPAVKDVEKELAELMFEDPKAYNAALLEQAEQRAMQRLKQKEEERQVFETFYKKNPDLAEDKDIVGLVYQQNADRLNRLHLDQAMDELATAARGRLAKVRQIPSGGKVLPSGPAITTGATSGPGVQPQVTQKQLTFVEQIEALRQKRRKA